MTSHANVRATNPRKVAVVTGASRGIGAGLVTGFRALSYAVVGTAESMPPSDDPECLSVEGDIADPNTADEVIGSALEHFGRIDTLVNNAGIFIGKRFTEYSLEDYNAITSVNLAGFFHITQRAIRQMVDQGGGHVVNVSTSLVDDADRERPSALAVLTKGGLAAVARSLAVEYALYGVRVNAVSLGVIQTPMNNPASYDALAKAHPLGRVGSISDVVEGILYLEQATFVTGEILHIDGGQSAGH